VKHFANAAKSNNNNSFAPSFEIALVRALPLQGRHRRPEAGMSPLEDKQRTVS
jgi:hypothetical protein